MRVLTYGEGKYQYRVVKEWGRGPEGREPGGWVAGMGVDSQDRVYAFVRGEDPVQVYDREGRLLTTWGQGMFPAPHGIWISPEDIIYLTDRQDHTVKKYTTEGKLIEIMGTRGVPGKNGAPFIDPNDAVVAPSGELYIGDTGNNTMRKYSPDGELILSWGKEGDGPGEFTYIHNVRVDSRGRILVTDREASRLQIFDSEGSFLTQWEIRKPNGLCIDKDGIIYVTEEEKRKVNLYNEDHELLAQWGVVGKEPGQFRGFVHGVCTDSRNDLYVCEIMRDDRLQKFERL